MIFKLSLVQWPTARSFFQTFIRKTFPLPQTYRKAWLTASIYVFPFCPLRRSSSRTRLPPTYVRIAQKSHITRKFIQQTRSLDKLSHSTLTFQTERIFPTLTASSCKLRESVKLAHNWGLNKKRSLNEMNHSSPPQTRYQQLTVSPLSCSYPCCKFFLVYKKCSYTQAHAPPASHPQNTPRPVSHSGRVHVLSVQAVMPLWWTQGLPQSTVFYA